MATISVIFCDLCGQSFDKIQTAEVVGVMIESADKRLARKGELCEQCRTAFNEAILKVVSTRGFKRMCRGLPVCNVPQVRSSNEDLPGIEVMHGFHSGVERDREAKEKAVAG